MRRCAAILERLLQVAGAVLILINLIGYIDYRTISDHHPQLLDPRPRLLSESEFWQRATRRSGESDLEFVTRLTALVSDRMLLIDPQYARPTLCENWILWAYSQRLGYYEWLDTRRAVRLGGGFCSQHAIVLNNILRDEHLESRIVALNGHVVNEVLVQGRWQVFDADYNVALGASVKELENDPDRAYRAYRAAGWPERESRQFADAFGSEQDNWHFKSSEHYATTMAGLVERFAFAAVWAFPVALLVASFGVRRWGIRFLMPASAPAHPWPTVSVASRTSAAAPT